MRRARGFWGDHAGTYRDRGIARPRLPSYTCPVQQQPAPTPTPQPKQDAFVVSVIREPEPEITVEQIILGSLGVAGSLLVLALILGAVAGGVLVVWNRLRPASPDHLPPVSPSFPDATTPPPSPPR